jgi:hypothetical protein
MGKSYEEHFKDVNELKTAHPQLVKNLKSLIKTGTNKELDTVFDMVNLELWRR